MKLVLPGPLAFALLALAVAVICYVVHRWAFLSGLLAAATCLILGWISVQQVSRESFSLLGRVWVLNRPFVLLGREWAFNVSNLGVLAFIFFSCGLAFLFALPASQGWSFYPFSMGVISALILAVTAQQYIYSILFLWLASILAVFVLSGGRPGATTGAVRFLVFSSLAVMPLLTLSGYLGAEIEPDDLYTAVVLMIVGFGILLMLVPFHGQMVAIAAHTAPMVPAFMLSTFPPVVFHILFTLGRSHPALLDDRLFFDVCRWLGTAAVAIGGLAALAQRRWGYLVGYAALVDWGAGLIALGQGTQQGIEWATEMLVWRMFSLLLVGIGLTVTFKAMNKVDDMARCGGLLARRWFGVLALAAGLFSLAGFPLTPGAAGRWPLIADLFVSQPQTAWLLVLAGAGVSIGTLVGLNATFGLRSEGKQDHFDAVVALGFAVLGLWLVGAFYLHPAPWLGMAQRMLSELVFLPT